MVIVSGTATLRPEGVNEVIALARSLEKVTRTEPGCISYRFVQSLEDSTRFLVFEEWESEDNLQAHFAQEHTQAFFNALTPLLAAEPTITRYEVSFHAPL